MTKKTEKWGKIGAPRSAKRKEWMAKIRRSKRGGKRKSKKGSYETSW